MRLRAHREDVENDLVAVENPHVPFALEVPALDTRKLMVDDHDAGLRLDDELSDLINFSGSNQSRGSELGEGLGEASDHFSASGDGELFELGEGFFQIDE